MATSVATCVLVCTCTNVSNSVSTLVCTCQSFRWCRSCPAHSHANMHMLAYTKIRLCELQVLILEDLYRRSGEALVGKRRCECSRMYMVRACVIRTTKWSVRPWLLECDKVSWKSSRRRFSAVSMWWCKIGIVRCLSSCIYVHVSKYL